MSADERTSPSADPPVPGRPSITASIPCLAPPEWALAERALFALLDEGWRRFAELYTRPDGSLLYGDRLSTRDGADDFLEVFFNWPQLYLLGGADDLLDAATAHWHGVVGQLTELGMFRDEFEIGYDWFHLGESMLFFYGLTMADPARWRDRAMRFADLYVDPRGNYDAGLRIVRAPHNGSGGAREGVSDTPRYPWLPQEAQAYGFPLDWLVAGDFRRKPFGPTIAWLVTEKTASRFEVEDVANDGLAAKVNDLKTKFGWGFDGESEKTAGVAGA